MRKHYPLNSNGAEDAGKLPWTDGVPSTGVEGSYPGQALFTDTEAEILSAIDAAGLVRNGSDLTQLIQAASRGIWLGQFAGTATALTATLPNSVVIPSLQAGVRVRGIAASDFTGTGGSLKITGVGAAATTVSYPLVGQDGVTALASGAWKAGQFLSFDIDAAGNARFGSAISQAVLAAAKVPFNEVIIPITQRVSMSLPANSAGQFVTALSGVAYAKTLANSRLVVQGAFTCFSPIIVGQGAAAVTHRLRATGGATVLYDETTVTTGYYISNTNSPCHFGGSPLFVIDGLPAGNLSLDLLFKRDDNLAWSTILNPNTSDVPGYPTPNNGKLIVKEEFV